MAKKPIEKKYVVLRHLTMPDKGKCFFTTNSKRGRDCHGITGELWYEIVDFADTTEEAQNRCAANYGGLPTMKEFDDYAKEQISKRYTNYSEYNENY